MKEIKIAVVGHVNCGKTTFIRTLTKRNYGLVGDGSNIIKVLDSYKYESLQVIFIDCPGFTESTTYLSFLRLKKKLANESEDTRTHLLSSFDQEDFKYDRQALEGIKDSDVVLYIFDVEKFPEVHHKREIEIVGSEQARIIAVGNKSRRIKSGEYNKLDDRIQCWEYFLSENDIKNYVIFDAFWDNPSKVNKIYDLIVKLLEEDTDSSNNFLNILQGFKNKQKSKLRSGVAQLVDCIVSCRSVCEEFSHVDKVRSRRDIVNKIDHKISEIFRKLIKELTELYGMTVDNPMTLVSTKRLEDSLVLNDFTKIKDVLDRGVAYCTLYAAFGIAVGALAGGLFGAVPGGVAVIPGLVLGSKIGGSAGTSVGAIAGSIMGLNRNTSVNLARHYVFHFAFCCLAIMWAILYHGFGHNSENLDVPKVKLTEVEDLYQEVDKNYQVIQKQIDFLNSSKEEIDKWCTNFFECLETIEFPVHLDLSPCISLERPSERSER